MILTFTGTTNSKTVFVNTARFKLASGSELTIDRMETEFTVNGDGTMRMDWYGCYLWAIDGLNLFDEDSALLTNQAEDLIRKAELVELEIEDDADEGYELNITGWSVS